MKKLTMIILLAAMLSGCIYGIDIKHKVTDGEIKGGWSAYIKEPVEWVYTFGYLRLDPEPTPTPEPSRDEV